MLSSRLSRRIALLGLLGLAGCGFTPIYGGGAVSQGAYDFETDDSVAGYRLREQLQHRLGAPDAARFVITAKIDLSERDAATTEEGDTSRLNVTGSADWALIEAATNRQITAGTVDAFTSYSATGSTVATQTTRDDARARVAVILADMIIARVYAATPDQPQ